LLFYEAKGWHSEADEVFGQAVTRLRERRDMLSTPEQMTSPEEIRIILGLALVHKGWFQTRLGHFEQGKMLFQESLTILQRAGDSAQREMAYCLLFFGIAMYIAGEPAVTISLIRGSLPLFDQFDDLWGRGTATSFLGQATLALGQPVEAQHLLQESLVVLNEIGNQLNVAYTISALGHVAQTTGRIEQAEEYHLEALKIRTEIGEQTGLAFTLCDLGEVARLKGAHDQAKQYFEQALILAREMGLQMARAEALRGLGNLAERGGEYATANQFFQESLALSGGPGMYTHSSSAVTGLGWATLGLAEYQEAKQYFSEALKLEAYTQRLSITLDALAGLAHCLAWADEPERALELLILPLHHPASTQETKERATRLQAALVAKLSPEMIAAAQARGRARTLEGMLAEILAEKEGLE
jgi:tetratricopeptide (TPR) repeat protein